MTPRELRTAGIAIASALTLMLTGCRPLQNALLFHNHEGVVMFNTIPTYTP